MITLQNNQQVEGNPELRVLVDSGIYDGTDLIECYHINNPSVPHCMMQAQKIKYGDLVYHQEVPLTDEQVVALEAGEAISMVVAHDRFKDGFKKKRMRIGRIITKRGLHKGLTKEEIERARQEMRDGQETNTTTASSTSTVANEHPQPNPEPTPQPNPEPAPLPTPDPLENASSTTESATTTTPVLPNDTSTTTLPIADPLIDETVIISEPVLDSPVIDVNTTNQPAIDAATSTEAPLSRTRSKKVAGKIARRVVSKLKKL